MNSYWASMYHSVRDIEITMLQSAMIHEYHTWEFLRLIKDNRIFRVLTRSQFWVYGSGVAKEWHLIWQFISWIEKFIAQLRATLIPAFLQVPPLTTYRVHSSRHLPITWTMHVWIHAFGIFVAAQIWNFRVENFLAITVCQIMSNIMTAVIVCLN